MTPPTHGPVLLGPVLLGPVLVVLALGFSGCGGDERLVATFTSRVVQLDSCRTVGDRPETCTESELFADLSVDLVEASDDTFWLYGVMRDGVNDRAILGSRDSAGGFLFVDERQRVNAENGCTLEQRLSISLRYPDGVTDNNAADDPCAGLVGRQLETSTSSAACDTVNVPALPVQEVSRKRWEAVPEDQRAALCGVNES